MLGMIIRVPQLAPRPLEVVGRELLGAKGILIGEAHRIRAAAAGSQIPVETGGTVRGVTLELLVVGLETRSPAAFELRYLPLPNFSNKLERYDGCRRRSVSFKDADPGRVALLQNAVFH